MRDIQKMCRICLSQGSRDIFENSSIANLLARDDLSRIAEKLRFVTMLKVRYISRIRINVGENRSINAIEKIWARKFHNLWHFSYQFRALSSLFYFIKIDLKTSLWSEFYRSQKRIEKHRQLHIFSFYVCCLWAIWVQHRKKSTIAKMRKFISRCDQLDVIVKASFLKLGRARLVKIHVFGSGTKRNLKILWFVAQQK